MKLLFLFILASCSAIPTRWQELNRECHKFYLDQGLNVHDITKLCDRELRERK